MNIKNGESKKNKINVNLNRIKSIYFIRRLFEKLETKKLLEILKYNKQMMNILKINLNNYKEYSEIFSSIIAFISLFIMGCPAIPDQ